MYIAKKEFKKYYTKIRKNLGILHRKFYPNIKDVLYVESYISSSLLIMTDYMNLTYIEDSNKQAIVDFLMIVAIACWWIVDKFESEDIILARLLEKATGFNWRKIVRVEYHILKVLNYDICIHMFGEHPASPKPTNNMNPVFEEIRSCLFRLKSSNVPDRKVTSFSSG